MHAHTHTHTHTQHTRARTHAHNTHTHAHTEREMHVHAHTCTHSHVHARRHVHAHTHTHTHTHFCDTVVSGSEASFALKGMWLNTSVIVVVKLRGYVCVVLQAVDLLERTNKAYNILCWYESFFVCLQPWWCPSSWMSKAWSRKSWRASGPVMVSTHAVCDFVFILAFIILQFDSIICLVLNFYIAVSVNLFSDSGLLYFPNVFFQVLYIFLRCYNNIFCFSHGFHVSVSRFPTSLHRFYFTFIFPLAITWLLMLWKANCYQPCIPLYP